MKSVVITGRVDRHRLGHARNCCWIKRLSCVRQRSQSGRRRAAEEQNSASNFTPLLFDVTDEAAVLAAAREVRAALGGETLAGLVNNAGIAVAGPVLELSADEFRRQMDVNVIGPIIATQAFGPLLGSDPLAEGAEGPDRDDLFGRRQKRQSADVGLCRRPSMRSRDCRKACAAR